MGVILPRQHFNIAEGYTNLYIVPNKVPNAKGIPQPSFLIYPQPLPPLKELQELYISTQ